MDMKKPHPVEVGMRFVWGEWYSRLELSLQHILDGVIGGVALLPETEVDVFGVLAIAHRLIPAGHIIAFPINLDGSAESWPAIGGILGYEESTLAVFKDVLPFS